MEVHECYSLLLLLLSCPPAAMSRSSPTNYSVLSSRPTCFLQTTLVNVTSCLILSIQVILGFHYARASTYHSHLPHLLHTFIHPHKCAHIASQPGCLRMHAYPSSTFSLKAFISLALASHTEQSVLRGNSLSRP